MNDSEPLIHLASQFFPLLTILRPFDISWVFGLGTVVVLLFFSGMISGSEIAYFSLNPNQLSELKSSDKKTDKLILHHLDRPKLLLAIILISNNFINVAIVLISAWLTGRMFDFSGSPFWGFLFQVVIITLVLLLFGEIMPKIYARQKAMMFTRIMATPLKMLTRLFKPIANLLVNTTNLIDKRLQSKKSAVSISELTEVVDITHSEEGDDAEEARLLKGITTFGEKEVSEIMKARVDVAALDVNTPMEEVIDFIKEWGYSRIPVYEENFDHVKGILYIKDLLPHLKEPDFEWNKHLRQAFYVPENKKINDLLQDFKTRKIHLAIVVDEYGGTSGIVTLEDVLEEIVGEISDEFDMEPDNIDYKTLSDNSWGFEAKTSLNDVCKIIEVEDDFFDEVRGESDSLAGLVLELKGNFPAINEKLQYKNIEFEVLMMDERRIKRIKVTKKQQDEN